jgi:hypothetical protein
VAVYAPGARKAAKAHPVAPVVMGPAATVVAGEGPVMVTEAPTTAARLLSSTFMARFPSEEE